MIPRRCLLSFAIVLTGDPLLANSIAGTPVATIDEVIVIERDELASFVAGRGARSLAQLGSAEQHAAALELVDEHLLAVEARRRGAEQHPLFQQRMAQTRRMLLAEFLVAEEVGAKATSAEDYARRLTELRRDVFEACSIHVSNEAHALLNDLARQAAGAMAVAVSPAEQQRAARQATQYAREATLCRYGQELLPVRKVLVFYLSLPPGQRPDIEKPAGLVDLLTEMLMPDLLAAEALRRGVDQRENFKAKVAENEFALLRMFMRAELQRTAQGISADDETLRRWYETRLDRFPSPAGISQSTDLFAVQRERVRSDFLEERLATVRSKLLADLRSGHRIKFSPGALE